MNLGLGQALRTAFNSCRGAYVVTFDVDLSYAPEHIASLLAHIRSTGAGIVLASPYMPGGTVANVPRGRLLASRWANRLLSAAATAKRSVVRCHTEGQATPSANTAAKMHRNSQVASRGWRIIG